MSFRMPESDDPPSTPNTRNSRSFITQPSTTPKGAPPTYLTNQSFTPRGPPPRSVFGSSFNPSNDTFPRIRGTPLKASFVPESSPPREYDEDEDAEGEVDTNMDGFGAPPTSSYIGSMLDSPRGLKRSRKGKVRPSRDSEMPKIARGLVKQTSPPPLREPDDLVLRGEEILSSLDAELQKIADNHSLITESAAQLTRLWDRTYKPDTREGLIGPGSNDPAAKASYLASFLLRLHQPHSSKPVPPPSSSRLQRSTLSRSPESNGVPLPKALLDWLEAHHNPFPDEYEAVQLHQPSPSAHDGFWDVVYSSVLRGRFERATRLLSGAGWEGAITALDDGASQPGYTGRQLENTEAVVDRCVQIIRSCPAVRQGDWDIKSWSAFRQQVRQAISELEAFAEGDGNHEDDDAANVFTRSTQGSMNLSTASRRAESKVPWSVYENLKVVYSQLLGSTDEILLPSQDWLEASIFLTVWWDGEEEDPLAQSVNKSNFHRSTAGTQRTREVDVTPLAAYRSRLAEVFAFVTDQPEDVVFRVDTMDSVQVGLACAMVDDSEGVIRFLRSWSTPISSATVELAALAGWLPQARPRSRGLLEQGFDSEDLMVLSQGPRPQSSSSDLDRDELLSQYADLLAGKPTFRSTDGKTEKEGWELAVAVIGRLDDQTVSQRKIGDLLDEMELNSQESVDKVLRLCSDLSLTEQARTTSKRYADHLAETSQEYGAALIFYARAQDISKLKSTFALLTTMSLVQSAAMPPQSRLDPDLASLLGKNRVGLTSLAKSDPQAAILLSQHLSGYATVRKFYELRDQEANAAEPQQKHRPLERKREAAKALMVVVESGSDCIRGGLFDPEVESAIPVECLLVLLGEVLPLLGQEKRILTQPQVFSFLRVVEDLATAPSRIRGNAEELLKASMSAFDNDANPSSLLEKSRSDLSSESGLSGSSWDIVASSAMLMSQLDKDKGTAQQLHRGWDWRNGLKGVGVRQVGQTEVLTLLRLALTQEVARGYGGHIKW